MQDKYIHIRGAREHNLKNVDLKIPRNAFVVITGLSGSGKSSLAFDTIYAEGQRRYVESLSAYARQFLERIDKPEVEFISGLSPAISIEQRNASTNPRSIVGTTTEIYDYLRLLFSKIGVPHCYKCGKKISRQSVQEIVDTIMMRVPTGKPVQIFAPILRGRKGEHRHIFAYARKEGFVKIRIDGSIFDTDDEVQLEKYKKHNIEIIVDNLKLYPDSKSRLADSIETSLRIAKGVVLVQIGSEEVLFSELYSCIKCGVNYEELSPRLFSFNSPYGACPICGGIGTKLEIDPELVIPDKDKSLKGGAIEPWRKGGMRLIMYYNRMLRQLSRYYGVDLDKPFKSFDGNTKKLILYGTDICEGPFYFEGVVPNLERRFKNTESDYVKTEIAKYMSVLPCPECKGQRLKPQSIAVKFQGYSIMDIIKSPISKLIDFFSRVSLTKTETLIASEIIKEIIQRLTFMKDVGLNYLTLDRRSDTLSGGEAQRIRLATQIGARLVGVIYILDEPTIGLHHRDNMRLIATLRALQQLGNTLIIVEHDENIIREADYIIDIGPGAGKHGGEIVASGSLNALLKSKGSLTAKYLKKELEIPVPVKRRDYRKCRKLKIIGAREHNLKNIDVEIPLGVFICVTGVSGSGKSTLVDEILYKALSKYLYGSDKKPGRHKKIIGKEQIDKVIVIDQAPIGRTPRSNPATYTGTFTHIRELFGKLPESRMRGYKPGRFSFNVKGGRCEACEGDGIKRIEMHFLPDVHVRCEVCGSRRYNKQTLEVKYKGKSISDVLEMTVEEALQLFANIPKIKNKLAVLSKVGLGYIELGQSATTLSGGEAQRVKLSAELSKRDSGNTIYMLDEPTTGLHFADIDKLLTVLNALVEVGNTILVIEHNPEVIKTADYIIDLGPEGGDGGGCVVASGTPEEIAKNEHSYTGRFLKKILNK